MPKLFIKAQDLEEYDSVKVFNERGKEVYYTKDDFIATGHRIKIFLADTINECGYVQEKYTRDGIAFEFAARDKFGSIERDNRSSHQRYRIDYDEGWEIEGDAVIWQYVVYGGTLEVIKVSSQQYLIPGQALNMCQTYILDFAVESDMLIGLTFVLAIYALNKYQY
ncbi:MAG: hypothetical protein J5684_08385 [Eubacterium sp.]|nr:hypothetical protein [Eubacterium sp.]